MTCRTSVVDSEVVASVEGMHAFDTLSSTIVIHRGGYIGLLSFSDDPVSGACLSSRCLEISYMN